MPNRRTQAKCDLDPYSKLAAAGLQSAMTMAMLVDPTFPHIPPVPEEASRTRRRMPSTLASAYGWILPAIATLDRGIVIHASDEVFLAMQRLD